jgi:hypothetical protein
MPFRDVRVQLLNKKQSKIIWALPAEKAGRAAVPAFLVPMKNRD